MREGWKRGVEGGGRYPPPPHLSGTSSLWHTPAGKRVRCCPQIAVESALYYSAVMPEERGFWVKGLGLVSFNLIKCLIFSTPHINF